MPNPIAYPWFFFYRVLRLSLLMFAPTLILLLFVYRSTYLDGLVSQMTQQIRENLTTTEQTLRAAGMSWPEWCRQLKAMDSARYTLTSVDGTILCDTIRGRAGGKLKVSAEVDRAVEEGFAFEVRHSDVYDAPSLFAAIRLEDNLVLRKTVPISSMRDDLSRFDRVLFLRILPISLVSYLLFILLFYRASRPLGSILSKVEKFKEDIPIGKTLELLYKKNEWAEIEAALHEADQKLDKELRRTEEENRKNSAILEAIHDNIIAVDRFDTILFFNSNFSRNFQAAKRYTEIVPKIWQIFSDDRVLSAFRSVIKSGDKVSLKGLSETSPSLPGHFFDLTVTPLRGDDGAVVGALGVFYDVTEVKLTEQMRVDFVANVSHEIRTPLTSIKGYTQVLQSQQDKLDSSLHPFLEKIVANTERMISLFSDLLNLSVIEAQNSLKFEKLDLAPMVDAVAPDVINNYPKRKIALEVDLRLEWIRGDQRLMEQVLSNLIDNSCKYAGGDHDLVIRVESFEREGHHFIVISDTGPGVPKEHLQRIFERFYRLDASRETSRGTGLGLSIVKHIIAKHGGRIWAEARSPGIAFFIELPLS